MREDILLNGSRCQEEKEMLKNETILHCIDIKRKTVQRGDESTKIMES